MFVLRICMYGKIAYIEKLFALKIYILKKKLQWKITYIDFIENFTCIEKLLSLKNCLHWKKIMLKKLFLLKNYFHSKLIFIEKIASIEKLLSLKKNSHSICCI
jgi:hypothetical protein